MEPAAGLADARRRRAWREVAALAAHHEEALYADSSARAALRGAVAEFLESLSGLPPGSGRRELEIFYRLHAAGACPLDDDLDEIVELLLLAYRIEAPETHLDLAYPIAREHPRLAACAEVIAAYEARRPADWTVRLPPRIRVSGNSPTRAVNALRPLFKSRQEREFFHAARQVRPDLLAIPNAPLNVLLEYRWLKPCLSSDQQDYFFRATVDCVLFDPARDYRPVWFFELDSRWHDPPDRAERDRWKDFIFSMAGQRLLRIRADRPSQRRFEELLRAAMDGERKG